MTAELALLEETLADVQEKLEPHLAPLRQRFRRFRMRYQAKRSAVCKATCDALCCRVDNIHVALLWIEAKEIMQGLHPLWRYKVKFDPGDRPLSSVVEKRRYRTTKGVTRWYLAKKSNGACVFLGETSGCCALYKKDRPAACRSWFCYRGMHHQTPTWMSLEGRYNQMIGVYNFEPVPWNPLTQATRIRKAGT